MFKRVLCFCLSVLFLSTLGCGNPKKESTDATAVAKVQEDVEAIKRETDAAVERAKADFEKVKQETDAAIERFDADFEKSSRKQIPP